MPPVAIASEVIHNSSTPRPEAIPALSACPLPPPPETLQGSPRLAATEGTTDPNVETTEIHKGGDDQAACDSIVSEALERQTSAQGKGLGDSPLAPSVSNTPTSSRESTPLPIISPDSPDVSILDGSFPDKVISLAFFCPSLVVFRFYLTIFISRRPALVPTSWLFQNASRLW